MPKGADGASELYPKSGPAASKCRWRLGQVSCHAERQTGTPRPGFRCAILLDALLENVTGARDPGTTRPQIYPRARRRSGYIQRPACI